MEQIGEARAKAPPKPVFGRRLQDTFVLSQPHTPSHDVVLDMGEASREEGFRLNGCR